MTPRPVTRIAVGHRSIRWLLLGVALATFVICGRANTPSSHWRLIWHDEFDGDSIDQTKWTTTLAWSGDDGSWRHHNSNYLSYIMDDDVVVGDGTLKLQTQRRDVMNPSGRVYHYTEGMIQSKDKFWSTYGYYEIRARVPVEAGRGMWPAFWTLSNGWPPENDIGEWWTSNNRFHQGLAYRNGSGGVSWDDYNLYSPLPTGFHIYGMEWGPGYEVFYVDDVAARTVNASYVPDVPMYLILNSGVESARPPDVSTVFPNSFEVDYVRVYEWSDDPVVDNAGFEYGSLGPWVAWNHASIVAGNAHGGNFALRISTTACREPGSTTRQAREACASAATQVLRGLEPNTAYTLTGWGQLEDDSGLAAVGVTDFGGDDTYQYVPATTYTQLAVTFTTGPSSTTATLYAWSGSGVAYFDDFDLSIASGAGTRSRLRLGPRARSPVARARRAARPSALRR